MAIECRPREAEGAPMDLCRNTPDASGAVRRLLGIEAVTNALDAGDVVRRILVRDDVRDHAPIGRLLARARTHGIPVSVESESEMWRMSPPGSCLEILGLVGRDPEAPLEHVLAGCGAVWLLSRADYPSNVGVAIRTAEVGGADAVVVDARFSEKDRQQALRFSIHADRFMPVFWASSQSVIDLCGGTGRRIIAVESSGTLAPWDADLTGPLLLVAGNERYGIAAEILRRCPYVVRIPMAGFIPSYNLQAAVAAMTAERLRQLQGLTASASPPLP